MKKLKKYMNEVFKELKKVIWPSGKNMFKYSTAVIAVILFFSVYFYVVDLVTALIKTVIVG